MRGDQQYAKFIGELTGIVLLLGNFIPLWLSALIVGFAISVAGYTLTRRGLTALRQIDPAPRETIQTLKENKLWLEQQMR